jgi:poly(3-hydroxybutyrate) depolymerase
MERLTHLAARGVRAGVTVVLPSAAERIWHNFSVEDEPYLVDVIDDVVRRTCADPHAVVLVGFSNGADEAQTIGCVEADRWRAVVVVASTARRRSAVATATIRAIPSCRRPSAGRRTTVVVAVPSSRA